VRCKQCDYLLWNLRSRACPECAAPVRPSEHEFQPGAVEFRCPHCDQVYFGFGPRGALEPLEFECVRCHRSVHMDDMVLRPAAGVAENETEVSLLPWLERRRLGFWRAWLATVGLALFSPGAMMRRASGPPLTLMREARTFVIFTLFMTFIVMVIPLALFATFMIGAMRSRNWHEPAVAFATMLAGSLLVTYLFLLIWAPVTHGLLRLTGPARGGLRRTFDTLAFSSGAFLSSGGVPCVGGYFGWAWWCVSAVLGLRSAQSVSAWRAAFAVLPLPVLSMAAIVAGYAVLLSFAMRASASPVASPSGAAMASALKVYVQTRGHFPRHAVELIDAGWHPDTFLVDPNRAVHNRLPGTKHTLLDLTPAALPDAERDETLRDVRDSLPADVVAHRVGDFVFTYHGIDPTYGDRGLWVLVLPPTPPQSARSWWLVAELDGSFRLIDGRSWPRELRRQNALRASAGLPSLSDPAVVTVDHPALAPPQLP
jgi:hypothetical protein